MVSDKACQRVGCLLGRLRTEEEQAQTPTAKKKKKKKGEPSFLVLVEPYLSTRH